MRDEITIKTYVWVLSLAFVFIIGIAMGFNAPNNIESSKRLKPYKLQIEVKNGTTDTTYIYRIP